MQVQPRTLLLFGPGLLSFAATAAAADTDTEAELRAAQMMKNARQLYGAERDNSNCETKPGNADDQAIVVCAKRRPPPRLEPQEHAVLPHLKDVALGGPPVPLPVGGITATACFLQKCPKDLYFIDLKSIPEAPEGSEADKIAKGLKPAP